MDKVTQHDADSRTSPECHQGKIVPPTGAEDRAYLVDVLTRVSGPVLEALSENKLKERLPVRDWDKHRRDCTCTEAFARTLAGVAPWVELGPDATPEGKLRERFGLTWPVDR